MKIHYHIKKWNSDLLLQYHEFKLRCYLMLSAKYFYYENVSNLILLMHEFKLLASPAKKRNNI